MTDKIDKGFSFSYWRLSYRRKLIRTLWTSPVIFLLFLYPEETHFFSLDRSSVIALAFLAVSAQAYYNYYKWKITKEKPDLESRE